MLSFQRQNVSVSSQALFCLELSTLLEEGEEKPGEWRGRERNQRASGEGRVGVGRETAGRPTGEPDLTSRAKGHWQGHSQLFHKAEMSYWILSPQQNNSYSKKSKWYTTYSSMKVFCKREMDYCKLKGTVHSQNNHSVISSVIFIFFQTCIDFLQQNVDAYTLHSVKVNDELRLSNSKIKGIKV